MSVSQNFASKVDPFLPGCDSLRLGVGHCSPSLAQGLEETSRRAGVGLRCGGKSRIPGGMISQEKEKHWNW